MRGHVPPAQKKIMKTFPGNFRVNSSILLIFHTYTFGQKCLTPKVDWAQPLTPMSKIVICVFIIDRIYIVTVSRESKNQKELQVQAGDIIEVFTL